MASDGDHPVDVTEVQRLNEEAHPLGYLLVKQADWAQMRGVVAMMSRLSARFVSDGEDDCMGPVLAEPEVWARLHQLEAGAKGIGVDIGGLADAILRELGIEYGDLEKHPDEYPRTVQVLHRWFETPKEAEARA